MKKLLALLFASAMLATMATAAKFEKKNTYTDGQFTDVPETQWYVNDVRSTYEIGLMQGVGGGKFSPSAEVTVAEAITIASRVSSIYYGDTIAEAEGKWYQKNINYALSKGIIGNGQFDSYDRPAKRHEVAALFANALPGEEYYPNNAITEIPDVDKNASYYKDLLTLYRAGVLMGNDVAGTFKPDANITRAETAAIINRAALPEKRLAKSTMKMPYAEGYELMYSQDMISNKGTLSNGWRYDNKNAEAETTDAESATLFDDKNDSYSAIYREFNPLDSGLVTLEMYTELNSADNGVYIGFDNDDNKPTVKLQTENGFFALHGAEKTVTTIPVSKDKAEQYVILMHIDLDSNTMYAVINGTASPVVDIPENITIGRLIAGTTVEGTGVITVHRVYMYENYAMAEHFAAVDSMAGKAPYGMVINGNVKMEEYIYDPFFDKYSAKITATAGTSHSAAKSFPQISGIGIFEGYLYMPKTLDGAYFAVTSAGKEVAKIYSKSGAWYVGDKKERDFFENVWQTLRIETNTATKKATIKINGKIVDTISIDCTYIDGIKIGLDADENGILWFDDISARADIEHEDYPAVPKACTDDGYNIGVHVCNLWRDSEAGEGWQRVTPFEEFEPYIGYYDEGSSELADWEIKQMVEHGIDFQHLCWYMPETITVNQPIKMNRNSHPALHNGFFNAKYSDMMKFVIMWENGNGGAMPSFEAFKEYYWKYWKEYYFTDSRYMVIDNKPILSFCSYRDLVTKFQSKEKLKEAIDFMREDIKTLGFDDMIFICWIDGAMDADMDYVGIDATYRYHYNAEGKDADYQIKTMDETFKTSKVHPLPSVSVGYNYVPRGGRFTDRAPMNTPEGFRKVAEHIRDSYLPNVKTGDWKENTLFVSSWNEWSEGTYAAPSTLHGYEYLEAVKDVFTGDTSSHADVDVMPTAAQKARVNKLTYNKYQRIRRLMLPEFAENGTDVSDTLPVIKWDFKKPVDRSAWTHLKTTQTPTENGLKVISEVDDPNMLVKVNLDVTHAPVVHVRAKAAQADKIQLFFQTKASPVLEGTYKTATVQIPKADNFEDYYFDLSGNPDWTGTLTDLRIDPMFKSGEIEIELIEILGLSEDSKKAKSIEILANNRPMSFDFTPKAIGNDVEVTANPSNGFFSMLNMTYTWNRYTGILTLEGKKNHTVVYTVGSDKALVDGKEKALGYTFSLYDGLPVIRLKQLSDFMEYEFKAQDDYKFSIRSTDNVQEIYSYGVSWDFDAPSSTLGWVVTNRTSVLIANGHIQASSANGSDPTVSLSNMDLLTKDYSQLRVGVRASKAALEGKFCQVFYATSSTGPNFNWQNSFKHYYDVSDYKDGDLYEIAFNMSSAPLWQGTLDSLRFDPFNGLEDFSIDYIRLVRKGDEEAAGDIRIEASTLPKPEPEPAPNKVAGPAKGNVVIRWDFDKKGDVEGFYSEVSTLVADNGFLSLTNPTDRDIKATIKGLNLDASKCKEIRIGIKANKNAMTTSPYFQMFFLTDKSQTMNEQKSYREKYEDYAYKDGEIIELVWDLTKNSDWKDTITLLRFDPYNVLLEAAIDYIVIYDENS